MSYFPPPGWLERLDDPDDQGTHQRTRFHVDPGCPRVINADSLVAVERPYSAARCPACAGDSHTA